MAEDRDNEHSVWKRLNQQSDQIADIAKGQASTDARLESLESKFDDGFRSLNISINRMTERASQPTNWIGFGSMAVSIVLAMAGFVVLVTGPLGENQQRITDSIVGINSELAMRAFTIGADSKSIEWHADQLNTFEAQMDIERARNADIEERVSRMEGRQEMLVDRVKDIDENGSRKWNVPNRDE